MKTRRGNLSVVTPEQLFAEPVEPEDFVPDEVDQPTAELIDDDFDEDDLDDEHDGQPSELTEWLDFDPDC